MRQNSSYPARASRNRTYARVVAAARCSGLVAVAACVAGCATPPSTLSHTGDVIGSGAALGFAGAESAQTLSIVTVDPALRARPEPAAFAVEAAESAESARSAKPAEPVFQDEIAAEPAVLRRPAAAPDGTGSSAIAPVLALAPRMRPAAVIPRSALFTPDADLSLCRGYRVRNAPRADASRRIAGYTPFALVRGRVVLARAPMADACLTSGYGMRGRRMHIGIDLQAPPPAMVHAAGAGAVVEARWRRGYGNMVLIDHGHGVFSRYAHLRRIGEGVKAGARLPFGAPLGLMGATGRATGKHLHYEILTGVYTKNVRGFGLRPVDVFRLPSPRPRPRKRPPVGPPVAATPPERRAA